MKLIIQIPCLNEEGALPRTLSELPRDVPGVDEVEWLVIDDGSTDATVEVARDYGVDHVVRHTARQGLARAFMTGLDACLERGADLIVNTDADNQYRAADIPALVAPVVSGEADIVIGARPIAAMKQFSPVKRVLQRLASWTVRRVSRTAVRDAPSGFRAMSREAAMKLNVFSEYTYTLETIIQAGHKGLAVVSVPVRTNDDLRPSRLVRSIPGYLGRSLLTMIRIFMTYKPFEFFAVPGIASLVAGLALGVRFLVYYAAGEGSGHVQSVILAALLLGTGVALVVVGLLADLVSVNRKLLEKVDWRLRRLEDAATRTDGGARRPPRPRAPVEIDVAAREESRASAAPPP